MLDFCIYLLYRAGTAIASLLPVRVLFAIGSFLGLGGWLLLPKYQHAWRGAISRSPSPTKNLPAN